MTQTRKRFYVYSILVFTLFGIFISIFHLHNLWKANKGYIESSYNIVLEIKKNRIKEIVNNAIKEVDQQKQIVENEYKNLFDIVVGAVKAGPGNVDVAVWAKKLAAEYPSCGFHVWDNKSEKLLFTTEQAPTASRSDFLTELKNYTFSDIVEIEGYFIGIYISKDVIESEVTNIIKKLFHSYVFDSEGYIWVNKVLDYNGGEGFGIRLIHPNLIETEGQLLSTKTQDLMGNFPYLDEFNGIKKDGEVLFKYYFKKKNSDMVSHKMTYTKLYPDFDWLVATGVHLDDIENFVKTENEKINNNIWKRLIDISLIMLAFIIIMAFSMFLLERRYIQNSQKKYIRVKKENEELESIAFTDPLTKLYNRRGMGSYLNASFLVFQRNKDPLCVIMGDIDNFKSINDLYGHDVGDEVLIAVSSIIQSAIRNTDVACRWGGEEFLIALPAAKPELAMLIAERIRSEIVAKKVELNDICISVTCSFGVSVFYDDDEGYAPSVSRADQALYQSKKNGKNKVTLFKETE